MTYEASDETTLTEDFLQSLVIDEEQIDAHAHSKLARERRVASAKAASKSYTAKVDAAEWFSNVTPARTTKPRGQDYYPLASSFQCNRTYRTLKYLEAFHTSFALLDSPSGHQDDTGSSNAKLVEVLDQTLRCALSAMLQDPELSQADPAFRSKALRVLQIAKNQVRLRGSLYDIPRPQLCSLHPTSLPKASYSQLLPILNGNQPKAGDGV